jgi:hypothetical protein
MLMSLIAVIVLVGVALWAVNTYLPMQPMIKSILNLVVILVLLVWIAQVFGLFRGHFRTPKW